jgi:hypothetical protein
MQLLVIQFTIKMFHVGFTHKTYIKHPYCKCYYQQLHKTYVKHLNYKLYYRQQHLKCLCTLARYRLQAPWGWHDSVETCNSVIICEIIVHLLVIVQNNITTTLYTIRWISAYKNNISIRTILQTNARVYNVFVHMLFVTNMLQFPSLPSSG